ncbi:DUF1202 family protein, partial [Escherichia coli]|nr:DUF1202 family protein [Escherichia coli]
TDGDGSHGSTSKTPSYTKSVSWHHYRKLQDDWITLEKGQYPLTMKVSEINSKKVAILMKIDDINQANERWKKDTEQLRRNGVIK